MIATRWRWHAPITMFRKFNVHLLALALVGCGKAGTNDELADDGDSDTETDSADADTGDSSESSADEIGEADLDEDETESDGSETSSEDCEFDLYTTSHFDWVQASGLVSHSFSTSGPGFGHRIHAMFIEASGPDETTQCVEWLVGDAEVELDACHVYHGPGYGTSTDWPQPGYLELQVNSVTFDLGDGPVALVAHPNDGITPLYYDGDLPATPDAVPFAGKGTLAVDWDVIEPDLDLELDIVEELTPITPAYAATTFSSEELASWTWSNAGGAEPIEIKLALESGETSEQVVIHCLATDDGEFAFPSDYFDLARERLGPDIAVGGSITRRAVGQVPFLGHLFWRSSHDVVIVGPVVD